jgi:ATP-binding cassette subfamily D (ALD) protein 3
MIDQTKSVIYQRLFTGTFDSLFVKYGATLIGFTIVALPIFGPESSQYMRNIRGDYSAIARDFMKNASLLMNLGKAIGKIFMSYKEMQNLAGYTNLITEIMKVLGDLQHSVFYRKAHSGSSAKTLETAPLAMKGKGAVFLYSRS